MGIVSRDNYDICSLLNNTIFTIENNPYDNLLDTDDYSAMYMNIRDLEETLMEICGKDKIYYALYGTYNGRNIQTEENLKKANGHKVQLYTYVDDNIKEYLSDDFLELLQNTYVTIDNGKPIISTRKGEKNNF